MGRYVQCWVRLQGCLPKEWIGMFDAVFFKRNMVGATFPIRIWLCGWQGCTGKSEK